MANAGKGEGRGGREGGRGREARKSVSHTYGPATDNSDFALLCMSRHGASRFREGVCERMEWSEKREGRAFRKLGTSLKVRGGCSWASWR